MAFLEPVTLQGAHARLEPLSHDHIDGLMEAVSDGELWKPGTPSSQLPKT